MGIMNVPAEFVVGTKTHGRSDSFARNWMPIMANGTEFSGKWRRLCDAHLNEGIRDAVKVYEYMNRYYVEEGNKRVSVLKFFGAVNILADVIRILPEKSDDPAVVIYYESLDFVKLSKAHFLEFTRPGSYAELQRFLGKGPSEAWTEEEQKRFSRVYHYFQKAFNAKGGKKLRITVGDALLAYIRIYGYSSMTYMGAEEMKKHISNVWEEITLAQEETPIDLKTDPEAEKKAGMLSSILGTGAKPLHVAFIHDKNPEESGWTMLHETGRRQVQHMLDGKIETTAYFNALDNDPEQVIEQAIADGNTVVFTTSPLLLPACLKKAVEHKDKILMNCSLNKSHRYIRSYYARMYEAKFILGAIAGTMTDSGRVGYICDYPIFGQIAGINAFAQGVQMTNPKGKVYLEWSSVCGVEECMRRLEDQHIHVISSQDASRLKEWKTASFGLCYVRGGKETLLATPTWNWGAYYESLIRRILSKNVQEEYEESSKALNYYWGMSAGVVGLSYSDSLPESQKKLGRFLSQAIISGSCTPFYGPLHTQEGGIIDGEDHRLSLEQIVNMNDLMDNVIGTIPEYKELSPTGRSTVKLVGVEKSAKGMAETEAEERAAEEKTASENTEGGE